MKRIAEEEEEDNEIDEMYKFEEEDSFENLIGEIDKEDFEEEK
jgi:hypothetical protein